MYMHLPWGAGAYAAAPPGAYVQRSAPYSRLVPSRAPGLNGTHDGHDGQNGHGGRKTAAAQDGHDGQNGQGGWKTAAKGGAESWWANGASGKVAAGGSGTSSGTWSKPSGGGSERGKLESAPWREKPAWDKPDKPAWDKPEKPAWDKPAKLAWDKPQGGNNNLKPAEDDGEPDVDLDAEPHFLPAFMEPPTPVDSATEEAVIALRESMQVKVVGEAPGFACGPITSYSDLSEILPDYVTEALAKHGIDQPMPIQAQTLPFLLSGFDCIGIAKTGSGKTLAFILPAIAHIERQAPAATGHRAEPIALVLAPVRELAVQIRRRRTKYSGTRSPQPMPKAWVPSPSTAVASASGTSSFRT